MFYSDNILTRKGPLAHIWLAAHWERRLTKNQIVQTNIEKSVRDIVEGALPPMALRLSGQLLLGVAKIYGRKAHYLLEDCSDALSRVKLAFRTGAVDLPPNASKAAFAAITMPAAANLDDALALEPELDIDALLRQTATAAAPDQAIRGSQSGKRADLDYNPEKITFGLENLRAEGVLPMEFEMDVEFGRRATIGDPKSDQIDPLRQSIEGGRKVEDSPTRNSLPFSPLRTPIKSTILDFDPIPLDQDLGHFDEQPGLELGPDQDENREAVLDFSQDHPLPWNETSASVHQAANTRDSYPALLKTTRLKKKISTRSHPHRRRVVLDVETEIANSVLQHQIRDTSSITLPRPTCNDLFVSQALELLSIGHSTVPTAQRPLLSSEAKAYDDLDQPNNQHPLQDEDYMISPADLEMMAPSPPSPKSPRLLPQFNNENTVPDQNRQSRLASPPASPIKNTPAALVQPLFNVLGEELQDTLQHWQGVFRGDGKVSFDSLIAPPARRRQAAEAFLQLLVFHNKSLVKADQVVPYGGITVHVTPRLFTATQNTIKVE